MRLVSTDPEFSWGGTGYIVGAFAVLGAMAGLVTAGRRRGWGRLLLGTRAVGIVLSLGCFVAAGTLMLPTIVPAALGWARSDWPRPVRAGLLLFGTVAALAVVITLPGLTLPRRLLAVVTYLLLCPVEVAMTARLYAPSLPPGSLGRAGKVVPAVAGTVLIAAVAVMIGVRRIVGAAPSTTVPRRLRHAAPSWAVSVTDLVAGGREPVRRTSRRRSLRRPSGSRFR
jgi:hypothetical protein